MSSTLSIKQWVGVLIPLFCGLICVWASSRRAPPPASGEVLSEDDVVARWMGLTVVVAVPQILALSLAFAQVTPQGALYFYNAASDPVGHLVLGMGSSIFFAAPLTIRWVMTDGMQLPRFPTTLQLASHEPRLPLPHCHYPSLRRAACSLAVLIGSLTSASYFFAAGTFLIVAPGKIARSPSFSTATITTNASQLTEFWRFEGRQGNFGRPRMSSSISVRTGCTVFDTYGTAGHDIDTLQRALQAAFPSIPMVVRGTYRPDSDLVADVRCPGGEDSAEGPTTEFFSVPPDQGSPLETSEGPSVQECTVADQN